MQCFSTPIRQVFYCILQTSEELLYQQYEQPQNKQHKQQSQHLVIIHQHI